MSRRSQTSLGVVFVALVALCSAGCTRDADRPANPAGSAPNILLVTIDTFRADHSSVYGYAIDTTPNLRKLAADGTVFRRMYAPSATTGPSHAALFSGQAPRSVGVLKNGHVLHDSFLTLAEILAEEGYQTAAFVSSRPVNRRYGYAQGFERFDDRPGDGKIRKRSGSLPTSRRADETTGALLEWLQGRADGRPLFVWLHLFDPHSPYNPPELFAGGWPAGTESHTVRYDSEIHYADSHLGPIFAAFDTMQGAAGTIYVVTADHGEGLGEHEWRGHGVNLHEEAVRVPLILTWRERIEAGETIETPATLIDVAPTILELLAIERPSAFQGRSLIDGVESDRAIFLQRREYRSRRDRQRRVKGEMFAVVHNNWKYIRAPAEGRYELYDTLGDPGEKLNLADKMVSRRTKLERMIQAWLREHPKPEIEQPELSDEERDALRALGYID